MGSYGLVGYHVHGLALRSLAEDAPSYNIAADAEAAYLAGIIDGEGTIGIYDLVGTGIQYHVRLIVTNCSEPLIDWVHDRTGGSKSTKPPRDPRYRLGYQVIVVQHQAVKVIRRCLPYLVAKREQALLALEFVDGFVNYRGRSVADGELARRRILAQRISALNQPPGADGIVRRRMGRHRDAPKC